MRILSRRACSPTVSPPSVSQSAHRWRSACVVRAAQRERQPQQRQSVGAPGPTRVLSLDVGEQIEQLVVPVQSEGSEILVVALEFPLGVVFEAGGGGVVVAEITPGGAAEAAGVRVGDLLRATSAAMMRMTYPTMQLVMGGVGRPKLMRALVPTVGFPAAMDAVRSNKQLGEEITLYLERLAVDGGGAAGAVSVAAAAAAAVAGGLGGGAVESGEWQEPIKQQSAEGSVFDSSLFDDV